MKGHATLRIEEEDYRLRFGFSEIADADEYLGKSIIQALQDDPNNFHLVRVAFYFATREGNKSIRSVKQAGKVLEKADMEEAGNALFEAMKASGLGDEEEPGEA